MKIYNIRYGFATNSSSSHSVVLMDPNDHSHKYYHDGSQEYGWEHFICTTVKEKMDYLGQMVYANIKNTYKMPDEIAVGATRSMMELIGVYDSVINLDGYVDHQSLWSFPYDADWGKNTLDVEFLKELASYLKQDGVVVLGGNDNEETSWPQTAIKSPPTDGLDFMTIYNDNKAIKHATQGYWTLFSRKTGDKIRFSFSEINDVNAEKGSVPELVDLKITDYCAYGCPYCYQGSTRKGQDAPLNTISNMAHALQALGTFEVAIGGGEPTTHKNFEHILKMFKDRDIVPNFSTRNVEWIQQNRQVIHDYVGGIGYSVDSPVHLAETLQSFGPSLRKVMVQVVVGSTTIEELKEIMDICKGNGTKVLLLGWKSTNRGMNPVNIVFGNDELLPLLDSYLAHNDMHNYDYWNGPRLSVDTCLVADKQIAAWLEQHSDKLYFTTVEGAHSMYIDAVAMRMGASSYVPEDEMVALDIDTYIAKTVQQITQFFEVI